MSDVTICTPVGFGHTHLIDHCKETVQGQTVPVRHLIGLDKQGRGTGYVRNALLRQVTTKYVVFLDVDDLLYPTFIEDCLSAIKPNSYVYTGFEFWGGNRHATQVIPASPDRIWAYKTWHVVTTLLHTEDVKRAGGFDVTMPALEDTDFYMKLIRRMCICPIRLDKVLFRYVSSPDSRAKVADANGTANKMENLLLERYGYKMACCGQNKNTGTQTLGQKLEGDVLAQPTWLGVMRYYGKATRRYYGRVSRSTHFWCDPKDLQLDKQLEQIVDMYTDFVQEDGLSDYGVEILADENMSGAQRVASAMGLVLQETKSNLPIADKDKPLPKPNVERIASKRRKKTI